MSINCQFFDKGLDFYWGENNEKDIERAFEYFQKAAIEGDSRVYSFLGCMYELGDFVEKDLQKAVEYYQLGCNSGNFHCAFAMGTICLEHGEVEESEQFFERCNSILVDYEDSSKLNELLIYELRYVYMRCVYSLLRIGMIRIHGESDFISDIPSEYKKFIQRRRPRILERAFELKANHPDGADDIEIAIAVLDSCEEENAMDREQCREMVEEHWRAFLTFASTGAIDLGKDCITRFEEDIEKIGSSMSAVNAVAFVEMMDEERDRIHAEYVRSPEKLKARLGVTSPSQQEIIVRGRQPLSLGEVAVRTAVRATVWETVKSIFRSFR